MHPLKVFRKNHQPPLSQRDLAETVGVDRVTVARWESGLRRIDTSWVTKIAAATGIPVRELRPDLAALMEREQSSSE